MAAIDLCQLGDVRVWLGINPSQDNASTTAASPIAAGVTQTVTPVSMVGITPGAILAVGTGVTFEHVVVSATDDATGEFTADFNMSHAAPVSISNITDEMLGRLITSRSSMLMRKLNMLGPGGTIPAQSPLVQPSAVNEWRDGNGGYRIMLRQPPVQSVQAVTVNGINVPESTDPRSPGFVVDDNQRSIALRAGFAGIPQPPRGVYANLTGAWCFARGIKNVNIQYMGGFTSTPFDIVDACIEMVAIDYRRRNWIDQKQINHAETSGSSVYRDWEYPPKIQSVIEDYRRRWT